MFCISKIMILPLFWWEKICIYVSMQNMYNVHICIYILYCGVWSREEYRIPQNPRPENVASVERICQAPEICLSLQIFQTSIAS